MFISSAMLLLWFHTVLKIVIINLRLPNPRKTRYMFKCALFVRFISYLCIYIYTPMYLYIYIHIHMKALENPHYCAVMIKLILSPLVSSLTLSHSLQQTLSSWLSVYCFPCGSCCLCFCAVFVFFFLLV